MLPTSSHIHDANACCKTLENYTATRSELSGILQAETRLPASGLDGITASSMTFAFATGGSDALQPSTSSGSHSDCLLQRCNHQHSHTGNSSSS